jgi:hypothetical protein
MKTLYRMGDGNHVKKMAWLFALYVGMWKLKRVIFVGVVALK